MASSRYSSNNPHRKRPALTLNSEVSDVSEISYSPGHSQWRESLVSPQSPFGSATSPPPTAPTPERQWHGEEYPLRPSLERSHGKYQFVSSPSSSIRRFRSYRVRGQDTIREDEIIRALIDAAGLPFNPSSYRAVPDDEPFEPGVDITSFSGPMGMQDLHFLRSLQEEANSRSMNVDLEQGLVPSTNSRNLEQGHTHNRGVVYEGSSSFHAPTVVANEGSSSFHAPTGVVDEGSSSFRPPTGDAFSEMIDQYRPAPLSLKKLFCTDQNDWKPFSMRWPYLLFMVIISILLGIVQELMYQMSTRPEGLFHFTDAQDFNPGVYAAFKLAPTIITVLYGILWQITDSEVRRLEAFYQMSNGGRDSAAESVNVDYVTTFDLTSLFLVYSWSHYSVTVSSVATFLAILLVPAFGAATFALTPDRATQLANPLEMKVIIVNSVPSRLLTVTFFVIAILGCALFYRVSTRRSGLVADVKGIAGLASMIVVTQVTRDFKDLDTAMPQDIHHRLSSRRYEMRDSLMFSEEISSMSSGSTKKDTDLSENPQCLMLRKEFCIPLIVWMVIFFVLLLVFFFTPASAVLYKAPWIVTVLVLCVRFAWRSLEMSIRMLEPYYILSKRHAPARTLILDYTATPFAVVAIGALLNRHWVVFLVSCGMVLVEMLTILATSLAQVGGKDFVDLPGADSETALNTGLNSGSETARIFVVSLTLTASILLYLCIVTIIAFRCRRHAVLPRQPNTIASVLAYIHQSKMLSDFADTSKLSLAEMRVKLDRLGKTYGLGWFDGRDGQTHCGIDEEELSSYYKHNNIRGWNSVAGGPR